jgi:hypothetical protein
MHSVNPIKGNIKLGAKLWGVITNTYNNNNEPHWQRTPKNLKDHWSTYKKQMPMFNQIYNQESSYR